MIDFEAALLRYIVDHGLVELRHLQLQGVKADLFHGVYKQGWGFLLDYADKHGEVPGLDLLQEGLKRQLPMVSCTAEHMVDQLRRRVRWEIMNSRITKGVVPALAELNPEEATDLLTDLMGELEVLHAKGGGKARNLFDAADEMLELYQQTKAGNVGLPFPWPTMTKMTMGLWPKTVTVFFARPGCGKTFCLMIEALTLWKVQHTALIVSPEMGTAELAERFFALESGTSYRNLVAGQLGEWVESQFIARVAELKGQTGLWVLESEDDLKPAVIESAAMDLNVDAILVDSIYDLDIGIGTRQERMGEISRYLRHLAKSTNKPVVGMSQFSRAAEGKKHAPMGAAALSDQIAWDAHNLIGIMQDETMRSSKILRFEPLKVRRMAHIANVTVNWDFDVMSFSELAAIKDVPGSDPGEIMGTGNLKF